MRVPVDSHHCQHLVWSAFLNFRHSSKWYHIMVFIIGLHFLISNDAEHLFTHIFAIHMSSLVKSLFRSFAHYKNWFVSLLLSFDSSLYILNTSLLSHAICKCFLLVSSLPFHSCNSVFQGAEFLKKFS